MDVCSNFTSIIAIVCAITSSSTTCATSLPIGPHVPPPLPTPLRTYHCQHIVISHGTQTTPSSPFRTSEPHTQTIPSPLPPPRESEPSYDRHTYASGLPAVVHHGHSKPGWHFSALCSHRQNCSIYWLILLSLMRNLLATPRLFGSLNSVHP